MPKRKTIAILGASSVGKSSLIHQFMFCHLDFCVKSNNRPKAYFPNVYINHSLYEVALLDPPHCKDEDTFNMHEWAQQQFSCVGGQCAEAFILVYDVSVPLTFKYIQVLREQITESFETSPDPVPILVVGNKCDINKRAYPLHVVTEIVKKHWHCEYMECSAKFNWRVFAVFKEIMQLVDSGTGSSSTGGLGGLSTGLLHHPFNHPWNLNRTFSWSRGRRRSRCFTQFSGHPSYRQQRQSLTAFILPSYGVKTSGVSRTQESERSDSSKSSSNSINNRIRNYFSSCMAYCRTD